MPRGSVFVACDRKRKLTTIPTMVSTVNFSTVNPSESFRQVDQNTSITPAITR